MNMSKRIAGVAVLLAMVGWSLIAPQPARAQLLPPLPISSLIVNVTSPADGSTVSATVPVSASVTIVGSLTVRGVQFKVDGANLGAEDTSAPYSVSWNTTTASNGSHTLTAVATDLLGGTWTSDPVAVTVFNDTTPPTVPTGLTATAVSSSQVNLSWTASSDNVGVSGYRVYRGGTQIATRSTTSFTNTGLSASTTYTYPLTAYDAAGNLSAQSSSASATTPAPPDITPPSVTINQAAGQADPTSASPINFTAVFSEPVSGFSGAGVTIGGTAGGTKTVTVSGGPSTYNVAVSGMSSAGTVIATIAAGVAQDAAGNPNTASTSTDNSVTFTLVSPIVLENQQPGSGNWQMGLSSSFRPADDVVKQIKGYASATSVNLGESITFHVTVTPAQSYTMDVYRMGWYQGLLDRLMQSICPLQGVAQPACPDDA